jgi:hypothetical protein
MGTRSCCLQDQSGQLRMMRRTVKGCSCLIVSQEASAAASTSRQFARINTAAQTVKYSEVYWAVCESHQRCPLRVVDAGWTDDTR